MANDITFSVGLDNDDAIKSLKEVETQSAKSGKAVATNFNEGVNVMGKTFDNFTNKVVSNGSKTLLAINQQKRAVDEQTNAFKAQNPVIDRLTAAIAKLQEQSSTYGRGTTKYIIEAQSALDAANRTYGAQLQLLEQIGSKQLKAYRDAPALIDKARSSQENYLLTSRQISREVSLQQGMYFSLTSALQALGGRTALVAGSIFGMAAAFKEGWSIGRSFDEWMQKHSSTYKSLVTSISDATVKLMAFFGVQKDLANIPAGATRDIASPTDPRFLGTKYGSNEAYAAQVQARMRARAGAIGEQGAARAELKTYGITSLEDADAIAANIQKMLDASKKFGLGTANVLQDHESEIRHVIDVYDGAGVKINSTLATWLHYLDSIHEKAKEVAAVPLANIPGVIQRPVYTATGTQVGFGPAQSTQSIPGAINTFWNQVAASNLAWIQKENENMDAFLSQYQAMLDEDERRRQEDLEKERERNRDALASLYGGPISQIITGAVVKGGDGIKNALASLADDYGRQFGDQIGSVLGGLLGRGATHLSYNAATGTYNVASGGGTAQYGSYLEAWNAVNQQSLTGSGALSAGATGALSGLAYGQKMAVMMQQNKQAMSESQIALQANIQGVITGAVSGWLAGAVTAVVSAITMHFAAEAQKKQYQYGIPGVSSTGLATFTNTQNFSDAATKQVLANIQEQFDKTWNGFVKLLMKFPNSLIDEVKKINGKFAEKPFATFGAELNAWITQTMPREIAQRFEKAVKEGFLGLGLGSKTFDAISRHLKQLDPDKAIELLGTLVDSLMQINKVTNFYRTTPAIGFGTSLEISGAHELDKSFVETIHETNKQILDLGKGLDNLVGEEQINTLQQIGDLQKQNYDAELQYLAQVENYIRTARSNFQAAIRDLTLGGLKSPTAQADYLKKYLETLYVQLQSAPTAEQASNIGDQIRQTILQIVNIGGTIGPAAAEAYRKWGLDALQKAQDAVTIKLQSFIDAVANENKTFMDQFEPIYTRFTQGLDDSASNLNDLQHAAGNAAGEIDRLGKAARDLANNFGARAGQTSDNNFTNNVRQSRTGSQAA